MANKTINTNKEAEKDETIVMLKTILSLIQERLDRLLHDVDNSYALLNIGEIKGFAHKIKNQIENPFESLLDASNNIDVQIIRVIETYLQLFFVEKKDLLDEVHVSKNHTKKLHYSIFLKEDTTENRGHIFEFLDDYDLLDFSDKYPVHFQFMPSKLRDNLCFSEIVELV